MALIEARGRRHGKQKRGRELHHLRIEAGDGNRSHVVRHMDENEKEIESHEFAHPGEGTEAMMHIAREGGFEPSPEQGSEQEEPNAGNQSQQLA